MTANADLQPNRHFRDNASDMAESHAAVGASLYIAMLLLFLSGFSSLVFQVVWIRQLSLVVGVDVYAVTAGVAAFMGGLALGGIVFGRQSDRHARPLALYAGLEAAVAFCGIGLTILLSHYALPFVKLETFSPVIAWSTVFILIGIPAVLMGGTLPALMRSVTSISNNIGSAGGRLYAANTAGAIAGTLAAAFILIPSLGISGAAYVAAGCSIAAAAGSWAIPRRAPPAVQAVRNSQPHTGDVRLALALYTVAGAVALGYEVVWTQSIVQFMSTRSFAFAIVLATYLFGLSIGSAVMAGKIDRLKNLWSTLGLLLSGAGLAALISTALLGNWIVTAQSLAEYWVLNLTGNQLAGMSARFTIAAFTTVLPATVLLGAAFPVVLKIVAQDGRTGRSVGLVSAWNTLGSIVGTALTGFFLIPSFGFIGSLGLLAVIATAIGIIAVYRNIAAVAWHRAAALAFCATAVALTFLLPSTRFADLLAQSRGGKLVFYEEGLGAAVAVLEQGGDKKFRRLYIQGVSNTGDSLPSLRYMRLQALIPLISMQQQPQSALVIGLGTGITAGAVLTYHGLERRVAAELLLAVTRATNLFAGNNHVASDPRLDIRLRDGRRELLASADRYDLITLEPPPPSAAGVANLYSTDFYRLASSRLRSGGLVAQWLPLPTQNDEDTRSLVRSFLDVFPHVGLWTTELHEMMLVGSQEPLRFDLPRMQARFDQPDVKQALAEVGVNSLAGLMATWVTDRAALETYVGDAVAVTDDYPRIEYGSWVRPDSFAITLPKLMDLAKEPVIDGASAAFTTAMQEERGKLHTFYRTGLSAYNGDRAGWQRNAAQLRGGVAGNAYYSWFFGGATE